MGNRGAVKRALPAMWVGRETALCCVCLLLSLMPETLGNSIYTALREWNVHGPRVFSSGLTQMLSGGWGEDRWLSLEQVCPQVGSRLNSITASISPNVPAHGPQRESLRSQTHPKGAEVICDFFLEKNNQKFNNMCTSYMQGKHPGNGPSHPLKYHLHQKAKEVYVVVQIYVLASSIGKFLEIPKTTKIGCMSVCFAHWRHRHLFS